MAKIDTAKKKEEFLKYYEQFNCNIRATCKKIGIDRTTFYKWRKRDKKFDMMVKEIEEGVIDFVESALIEKINQKDLGAIIFFLKTKGKHRGWSEKENSVNVNIESKRIDKIQVEFIE